MVLLCIRCTAFHFMFYFMKLLMAQALSLSGSSGIYVLPYVMSATPTNLVWFANICHHPNHYILKNMDPRTNPWRTALSQLPAGCWAIDNSPADFQPIKQLVHPAHTALDHVNAVGGIIQNLNNLRRWHFCCSYRQTFCHRRQLSKHTPIKWTLLSSKFSTMYLQT